MLSAKSLDKHIYSALDSYVAPMVKHPGKDYTIMVRDTKVTMLKRFQNLKPIGSVAARNCVRRLRHRVSRQEEPCQASNLYHAPRLLDDTMQRGLMASWSENIAFRVQRPNSDGKLGKIRIQTHESGTFPAQYLSCNERKPHIAFWRPGASAIRSSVLAAWFFIRKKSKSHPAKACRLNSSRRSLWIRVVAIWQLTRVGTTILG